MKADRLFSLLVQLEQRTQVTTADLAREVGVSVRTVLRDLTWLQDAGFPLHVQRGRHGGVTLLPGTQLDLSRLAPQEIDHLRLVGLDQTQASQLGTAPQADRARAKLRAQPRDTQPIPLSEIVTVDNRGWFAPEPEGTEPADLVPALRAGRRLRILYRRSGEPDPTWQLIDPYGLLCKAGHWYLVADDAHRPRLFALARLAAVQPTPARRDLRDGQNLTTVAGDLTHQVETSGSLQVRARLETAHLDRARRILAGRLLHSEDDGPHHVVITLACQQIDDARQLLQFGEHLTVIDPPEARALIVGIIRQMAHTYHGPSGGERHAG